MALDDTKQSLFVKKKAVLCLLRMFRKFKDKFNPESWAPSIIQMFDQRISLGWFNLINGRVHFLGQQSAFGRSAIDLAGAVRRMRAKGY